MPPQLTFPPSEYHSRLRHVESAMSNAGLDALIAYSVRNAPGPAAYLVGYEPRLGLHDVAYVLVAPASHPRYALLTNAFWDQPAERTWIDETIITADFAGKLAALLPRSARRVGIAGYNWLPAPVLLSLTAAFSTVHFEDATRLLWDVAAVKSPAEIAVMRECCRITDAGGEAFLRAARAGVSERQVRAEIERAILLAGADGLAYAVQLYSGAQVAVGIGFDRDRILAAGDQVQVDCGAVYRDYRGDLSRVTTICEPAPDVRVTMEATAEMYEAMLAAIHPGLPAAELARIGLAAAARRNLSQHVYQSPNHPGYTLGHGIGCWYHQTPEINPDAAGILEAGMVAVLEPILTWPGVAGAKIEDSVLVTPTGAECLSRLPPRTWPE